MKTKNSSVSIKTQDSFTDNQFPVSQNTFFHRKDSVKVNLGKKKKLQRRKKLWNRKEKMKRMTSTCVMFFRKRKWRKKNIFPQFSSSEINENENHMVLHISLAKLFSFYYAQKRQKLFLSLLFHYKKNIYFKRQPVRSSWSKQAMFVWEIYIFMCKNK